MLSQESLQKIISTAPDENDHWDFKLQWYKTNARNDLLLDIMNMVNTPHHDDCYIIVGIDNETGNVVGIKNDNGRMNRQELQDFLRSKPFAQNFYPMTDVTTYKVFSYTENEFVEVDVITIFNEDNTPIYLNQDIEGENILDKNGKVVKDKDGKKITKPKIHQGLIHSRINDSNTPRDRSTNDAQMELLWKKRLGLDLNIFSKFKHNLDDIRNWFYSETEFRPKYIYQINPDFVVEEAKDSREKYKFHFVCWAQSLMNVYVDYRCIQLKYRGIVIKEYIATVMDGGRFIACDPETGNFGNDNFFDYYVEDSLKYFVNEMMDRVKFPNEETRSWEGYNQIKRNLVVFRNKLELNTLKDDKDLKQELNQGFNPKVADVSNLSRKLRNNSEGENENWSGLAREFLTEKNNARVIGKYINKYRQSHLK